MHIFKGGEFESEISTSAASHTPNYSSFIPSWFYRGICSYIITL